MATQRLKGLWIPAEILLNEELTDKEKLILAMILYLSVVILQKYLNVIKLFNFVKAPKKLEAFSNVKCRAFITFK